MVEENPKTQKSTSIAIILFGLLIVTAVVTGITAKDDEAGTESTKNSESTVVDREPVPDISLKDYAGNSHALRNTDGRIAVINVWASWCPFCVKELADFAALQKEFPSEIIVIAINRGESAATAENYTSVRLGLQDTMLFLLDSKQDFYKAIGAFSMPETIFADANGEIFLHKRGPLTLTEMREVVKELLQE